MKTVLVHLSDIHFRSADSPIVPRVAALAAAIRSRVASDVEDCVIAVSGDIAYSGQLDEYAIAERFFRLLERQLRTDRPDVRVHWIFVPGNHDCDFATNSQIVRSTFTDAVRLDLAKAAEPEVVLHCTSVQEAFFAFRDSFQAPTNAPSRLFYEVDVPIGPRVLRFHCINSAWLSQRHEQPGTLALPSTALRGTDGADFAVAILHHPYNWLDPNNLRSVRKVIESQADLVLTGHEHEPGTYGRHDHETGAHAEYIEGAVLQNSDDPADSGFHVIAVDLLTGQAVRTTFSWYDGMYVPQGEDDVVVASNTTIRKRDFQISEAFADWLSDPGIKLTHSAKRRVSLDDIFVWPDVREISYTKKTRAAVSASKLADRALEEHCILLTGAERSGKTVLAKALFGELSRRGVVPVLLSCAESRFTSSSSPRAIEKAFKQQYARDEYHRYEQLPLDRRALVIDDLDKLALTKGERLALLDTLSHHAGVVIVTANELTHQIEDIVYSKESRLNAIDFHAYRIQEFGHVLRHSLVERWFSIGCAPDAAAARMLRDWPEMRRIIDTVVGTNFVPAYPVFVLSILQSAEAARPIDTTASTYGYFYETLVRDALNGTGPEFDPNMKTTYLSLLARHQFDFSAVTISEADLREFHSSYERQMDLAISFARFIDSLVQADVLQCEDDVYRFKYRYTYYYFVAIHLRDHIGEMKTRQVVQEMASTLHVEENANILVFLAHVSRDPFIIETMLAEAKKIYADRPAARLEDDITFLNDGSSEFELTYEDGDVTVTRRRLLSTLDEYDDAGSARLSNATRVDEQRDLDSVMHLNVALKTIQILGQVLKNFTGSILADTKVAIAECCYLLGLRTLDAIMDLMRNNEQAVVAVMFDILKREHPSSKDDVLFDKAKAAVFRLAQIISYGIVKRIASALGSPLLTQTYKRVRVRNASTAVSLIDLSLKLDNARDIPEADIGTLKKFVRDNPLADSLLKQLVIHHFYIFDVHYSAKQRICAKLKIQYTSLQTADRRQKLVVAPAFEPRLLPPAR